LEVFITVPPDRKSYSHKVEFEYDDQTNYLLHSHGQQRVDGDIFLRREMDGTLVLRVIIDNIIPSPRRKYHDLGI
jgi:hypothetical protein